MFTFLLILQSIIAALMVVVILLQRSEGGGLGVGGSPTGLMSARGAADFLTRATGVLATFFVILCIVLAGLASYERAPTAIDPNLARTAPARQPLAPAAPGVPVADPLAGAAQQAPATKAPPPAANGSVPLAQ
ncbi:MAG: preprotein translocase subunit SecG [Sphingomonadales bacterium]|jgi:preprotein translocase subunit SecG|nr:preprotein translocase subunit SecG [Sphingomonadales bacterium]